MSVQDMPVQDTPVQAMTRRYLAALAAGSVATGFLATTASAQTPLAAPDYLQAARDSKRAAAAELAAFPLDNATEPAFQFKT